VGKVTCDMTMSLDALVAGPNQSLENAFGEGGQPIHARDRRRGRLAHLPDIHEPGRSGLQAVVTPTHQRWFRDHWREHRATNNSGGGIWTHFPDRIAYRFVEERPLSSGGG
jgi:hypothetical protein